MSSVVFEDDPSPSLRRNLSYPDNQENFRKFTASPASQVGLQGDSGIAFWHKDLLLTSVVSMTKKLMPIPASPSHPSKPINKKRDFWSGFFCSCWDSRDPHGRDEWGIQGKISCIDLAVCRRIYRALEYLYSVELIQDIHPEMVSQPCRYLKLLLYLPVLP